MRKRKTASPTLKDVQRVFADAVMQPLTAGGNTARVRRDGRTTREILAPLVKPNDRLTSFERLEIYNKQYWFRLFDCLHEDFPGVRAVLGPTRFAIVMRAYLETHPSQSYTLRDLGRSLPTFLESNTHLMPRAAELAVEIARLEWANVIAFDGPTVPAMTSADGVDAATTRLTLQPNITLLACRYPVDTYLLDVKRSDDETHEVASNAIIHTPERPKSVKVPRPRRQECFLVVHRHDNTVYYKRVDAGAFAALSALARGTTITGACARALPHADSHQDFAAQVQEWFTAWMALGWLIRKDALRGNAQKPVSETLRNRTNRKG